MIATEETTEEEKRLNDMAQKMNSGSPIQNVATQSDNSGVLTKDSSELYTVDKSTDTVRGQLDNYTNFDTPLMKRIAQQGIDQAAGRGLTNSSIAGGNAIGKVLDKAGEWATTDAGAYNNRKTESLRSATSVYGIDESASASRYGSDKSLEQTQVTADASKYGADKTAEASMYGSDKQLEGSKIQASATVGAAQIAGNARIRAESINASSNAKIEASRAKTAADGIKADAMIAKMDIDARSAAADIKVKTDAAAAGKGAYNSGLTAAGNTFTTGVANIDITASPKSQKEQLARLTATHNIEVELLDKLK
tara:strand:+ start:3762 stop:4688 length:927 start_codon:yes stop_codon:yes gene_type:complete